MAKNEIASKKLNSLSKFEAEQKIQIAALSLGISFIDAINLFKYDPEAETAYWTINRKTGEESIHIGTKIAELSPQLIAIVLRHELLHRALFHGFNEQFDNQELANLVLDICINRLLYEAYPTDLEDTCAKLYPPESKNTIVALADVSAKPEALDPELAKLWHYIWDEKEDGSYSALNPASLYFKLSVFDDSFIGKIVLPFAIPIEDYDNYIPHPGLQKAIDKVIKEINKKLFRQSSLAENLSEYSVSTVSLGLNNLEVFIRKIRVKRVADKIATKILEPYQKKVNIQPYLKFPSRLGIIYQIYGISDIFRLYWNVDVENFGAKLSIGVYLDVSGSMIEYFDIIISVIEKIKELPLVIKTFDTSLREIDYSKLKEKKIIGGGGTNLNLPIIDVVENNKIDAGVIFTDGYGEVEGDVGQKFLQSKKRLYVVYFNSEDPPPDSLDPYATSSFHILKNLT